LNKCKEIFDESNTGNEYYIYSDQGDQQCVAIIAIQFLLKQIYETVADAMDHIYKELEMKKTSECEHTKIKCVECNEEKEWTDFTMSQHIKNTNEKKCSKCTKLPPVNGNHVLHNFTNDRKCKHCDKILRYTYYSQTQLRNVKSLSKCNLCAYSYINGFPNEDLMKLVVEERKQRALIDTPCNDISCLGAGESELKTVYLIIILY